MGTTAPLPRLPSGLLFGLVLDLLATSGCVLPDDDFDLDGWTAAERDCDDLDPTIHPDATEVVGDGIDQDCDGSDIRMVVFGERHVCTLADDGIVTCSGDDHDDKLAVPSGQYVSIAAGYNHTCALDVSGIVRCWGEDNFGQASPPEDEHFVAIDAAANWSIGSLADGSAICWGRCIRPALPLP